MADTLQQGSKVLDAVGALHLQHTLYDHACGAGFDKDPTVCQPEQEAHVIFLGRVGLSAAPALLREGL